MRHIDTNTKYINDNMSVYHDKYEPLLFKKVSKIALLNFGI